MMFRDVNYLFAFSFVVLEPPIPMMDQTLCLNVGVPTETVLLNCEPENPDEPSDPFMYQWMRGTTDLGFTQSTFFAGQVGNYTCTVSNSIGSAMTMFTVVGEEISFLYHTFLQSYMHQNKYSCLILTDLILGLPYS